jgi:pyruvate kinase
MIESQHPTRAEATDVANAVLDGTDAVMLSEETAIGEFPVAAVRVLDRIARATEPYLTVHASEDERNGNRVPSTEAAISRSACLIAEEVKASAIVAVTTSGSTARMVSRFRPRTPLLALTQKTQTLRQLNLTWGALPVFVERFTDTDQLFTIAQSIALERGLLEPDGKLVVTAGVPPGIAGTTNLLRVLTGDRDPREAGSIAP